MTGVAAGRSFGGHVRVVSRKDAHGEGFGPKRLPVNLRRRLFFREVAFGGPGGALRLGDRRGTARDPRDPALAGGRPLPGARRRRARDRDAPRRASFVPAGPHRSGHRRRASGSRSRWSASSSVASSWACSGSLVRTSAAGVTGSTRRRHVGRDPRHVAVHVRAARRHAVRRHDHGARLVASQRAGVPPHPLPLDAGVPAGGRDRAAPDLEPDQGARGSRAPGHRSARRVHGRLVPERAHDGGRLVLRGGGARPGAGQTPPRPHVLAGIAVGIAVAVGASRVLLGVHWFTDVLAGLALGWSWFAICSIAFGGRLMRFGAPVEIAERAEAIPTP